MVEIALSIAIVAFAMVAIIGVLPTGFQVQRDNREETIINQDGAYWMEAVRSGGLGLDELGDFVDRITVSNSVAPRQPIVWERSLEGDDGRRLWSYIVGLLSTPTVQLYEGYQLGWDVEWPGDVETNEVTALVRSISGSAGQRLADPNFRDNAFSYLLTSTVKPYVPAPGLRSTSMDSYDVLFGSGLTVVSAVGLESDFGFAVPIFVDGSGRIFNPKPPIVNPPQAPEVMHSMYEVQLRFRWPVTVVEEGDSVTYRVGRREKVFRSLVSGRLRRATEEFMATHGLPFVSGNLPELFYFEPGVYLPPSSVGRAATGGGGG